MGLGDFFKSSENKDLKATIEQLEAKNRILTQENHEISAKVAELESLLTPEHKELESIQAAIETANTVLANLQQSIDEASNRLKQEEAELQNRVTEKAKELQELEKRIIRSDEDFTLQSFGLYEPTYAFAHSEQYKQRLSEIRDSQKKMIKDGTAATGATNWTVNGSKSDGKKMVKDMQKLLLRAFNSECDEAISKVKFNTFETAQKRITASKDAISKLGRIMNVSIEPAYYLLKIDELRLALEYQIKKQEEKEEQKRIREELREQAKLQKEIEEARRTIRKEQKHYQNALCSIQKKIESSDISEQDALRRKKLEIEEHLSKLEQSLKDVDYREANQKAGYVYIISNIGSFGENIYKIGMTRRLDPMERVDELGDASVPFNFDVHAMIFSEDAPKLEAALHRAFENKKLNMVNTRREFFNVSLQDIERVVKENYDKTVDFTITPPAQQYRESLLILQQMNASSKEG